VTIDSIKNRTSAIDLTASLQGYFFEQLQFLNKQSSQPLPTASIVYSSYVMDKFCHSADYFEIKDGKAQEKVLGLKLLESSHLSKAQQETALRDVGDTALFLCGYFSDSLNKKLVAPQYYVDIGCMAYKRLDSFVPAMYEVPKFFEKLSDMFEQISLMMSLLKQQTDGHFDAHERLILFSGSNENKKVS